MENNDGESEDLLSLTDDFSSWKEHMLMLSDYASERDDRLKQSVKEIEVLQQKRKILENEMKNASTLIVQLQESVHSLAHLSEENRNLRDELYRTSRETLDRKREQENEILCLSNKLREATVSFSNSIENLNRKHSQQVNAMRKEFEDFRKEKQQELDSVLERESRKSKERDDAVASMRERFEEQLAQARSVQRTHPTTPDNLDLLGLNDIFVKKLQSVSSLYEEKIRRLEDVIDRMSRDVPGALAESPREDSGRQQRRRLGTDSDPPDRPARNVKTVRSETSSGQVPPSLRGAGAPTTRAPPPRKRKLFNVTYQPSLIDPTQDA